MIEKPVRRPRRRGQVLDRGSGAFLIRAPLHRDPATGKRTYHNETFRGTRPQAEKRCQKLLTEIDDGTFFAPPAITVGELCDRWLEHARCRGVRRIALDHYRYKLDNYVRPRIGSVPLARLSPLALQEHFDSLVERGLAPLTVRNARSVLSYALSYGVRMRMLRDNPLRLVELPKAKRRPVRAMTEEESARFVEAARKSADGLPFVFWLFTGLRPVEFAGLRWADVSLVEQGGKSYGVAHITRTVIHPKGGGWYFSEPKTDKGKRPVYFPAWLHAVLMEHKARQGAQAGRLGHREHGLVFSCRNGSPLNRGTARCVQPLHAPAHFRVTPEARWGLGQRDQRADGAYERAVHRRGVRDCLRQRPEGHDGRSG
jgi:integrase